MPNNNWMSNLNNNTPLHRIVMPGSHDACIYELKPGETGWHVDAAVTQFDTIYNQCVNGARFFDIRIYKDGSTLRAGHFSQKDRAFLGSFGPAFLDVLNDLKLFINANQTETVILKISLAKEAKDPGVAMIERELDRHLYSSAVKVNLAERTLGQLRGKIVATFDKPMGATGSVTAQRLHLAKKETPLRSGLTAAMGGVDRSVLFLRGSAPTSETLGAVIDKQNESRKEACLKNLAPHMEMFYLTITASTGTAVKAGVGHGGSQRAMSVADNTAQQLGLTGIPANPRPPLKCKFSGWQAGSGAAYERAMNRAGYKMQLPVNIYMLDFVHQEVCDSIIAKNP